MEGISIGCILPSRGLSFSKTMDELLTELKPFKHKIFFSIGNTLPDCFNIPLEEALKDEFTHILIVEDDMIIPKGILKTMVKKRYPVVALDYPFQKDNEATTLHDPSGMALYTGTGFILIERWVLDLMPKPIFSTDTAWDMMITVHNQLVCWPRDVSKIKTYGLHDVNFGITLWSNDLPIQVMKRTAGQRKLKAKGKSNTNNGADEIYEITKVLRDNTAKSSNTGLVQTYLDRLHKVTSIQVLTEPPDGIYYEDGQARFSNGKDVVI
jgi:hypothetical protein